MYVNGNARILTSEHYGQSSTDKTASAYWNDSGNLIIYLTENELINFACNLGMSGPWHNVIFKIEAMFN